MRLSLRLPSVYPKVKRAMDPIFEHLVSDSAREKVKRVIRQLEEQQESLENSLYTVSNVGETRYFLSQNRSGLLMRE